jgi:hypothetical protein
MKAFVMKATKVPFTAQEVPDNNLVTRRNVTVKTIRQIVPSVTRILSLGFVSPPSASPHSPRNTLIQLTKLDGNELQNIAHFKVHVAQDLFAAARRFSPVKLG